MSTYSDLEEGIVYTVDDSAEMLTAGDYWPSSSDCKELIAQHTTSVERNVWRGIRPLYSTGTEVERRVVGKWNVEADTVLRVTVYPQRTVLIAELGLNVEEYHRTPDSHIPSWFFSSISASWWVTVQFESKDK